MKPYKITENILKDIKKAFNTSLKTYTNTDTDFIFKYTPKTQHKKINVCCLPTAYCKMLALVQNTTKEIAWHMEVTKTNKNTFCITEIHVYPQTVTNSTVDTDDTKYSMWIGDLPDEVFNNLKGQGHSHVNMQVNPSGVDTDYYTKLLKNVKSGFYLFLIMNKRLDIHLMLVDIDKNTIYEDNDIEFIIASSNYNENKWHKEQMKLIEEQKPYRIQNKKNKPDFEEKPIWDDFNKTIDEYDIFNTIGGYNR